jgi:uncharacterized protein (UPF0332 family)
VTDENRRRNIAAEREAWRRARDAAERNARAGDFATAMNRLYFAALHAAKAACLSEGTDPKTHRGLKSLLAFRLVHPGKLPEWVATVYAQLETDRDLSDYAALFTMTAERYAERSAQADLLLAEIERYLRAGGWL